MGILVLAVITGSISAIVALIVGYGPATGILVYWLAGLGSVVLIYLPAMWMCESRDRLASGAQDKLDSDV
ncbi:MAG: hypothetical protein AAF625_00425 [Pseudomonadota bacterium]